MIVKYGPFLPQNIYNVGPMKVESSQHRIHRECMLQKIPSKLGLQIPFNVCSLWLRLPAPTRSAIMFYYCLLIFLRVNYKSWMVKDAPTRTTGAFGCEWTNDDISIEYLQHFITFTHVSLQNKVLLVLNNHDTHLTGKEVKFYRENGICVVYFGHIQYKPQDSTIRSDGVRTSKDIL